MDRQVHSAHTLIVIALAERALGRSGDAARNACTAERLLSRFPAGRFSARSRERVNKLQVRLRSLQKALNDGVHGQSSKTQDSGSLSAPPLDWGNFASQRNFSSREVKACLAKIRRSAGPKESLAMLVDWAAVTPRAGSIGGNTGCFAVFVEELASITSGHALSAGTQCKLFQYYMNGSTRMVRGCSAL